MVLFRITLYEYHLRYSDFHKTYLDRAFLYLILNMLVVPGLAVPAGVNIFDVFFAKILTTSTLLQNFFISSSADFFVILLIQQICFGFMANINQFTLLMNYWMSPSFCLISKQQVERHIPLLKNEFVLFPLGYTYALNLTCLSIVFIFSIHVPIILILGVLYHVIRLLSDAHLVLNIFREEMDSSFSLVHNACSKMISALILFQVSICLNMVYTSSYAFTGLMLLVIVMTIVFSLMYDRRFLRPEVFLDEDVDLSVNTLHQWKEHFTHPILKSRDNLQLRRRQTIKNIHRGHNPMDEMPPIDENIELNLPEHTKSRVDASRMSQDRLALPENMIQIYTPSGSNLDVNMSKRSRTDQRSGFGKRPSQSIQYDSKYSNKTEVFDIYSNKYHTEELKKKEPKNPFSMAQDRK